MATQQYNLRWNNHTTNMLQVFSELFEKEQMVDVTITCQSQFLKAHKIVLGSCSQYFQEIFDRHESTPHPVIIMNGTRFEDIRAIVEFMYKGEVKVCEGELESLLETAESLQVKGLSNIRASRQNHTQNPEAATLNPTQNHNANSSSHRNDRKHHATDLSTIRNVNESGEKNINHNSAISNSINNNASQSGSGSRTQGNGNGDYSDNGTPMHLRRKRKRTSNNSQAKDVNENSNNGFSVGGSSNSSAAPTPVDEENSDDLPMTIKIDPPFIRDIDEDEDNWDSRKDSTTQDSCEGTQDSKAKQAKRSMGKSACTAVSEPKEKIPRPPNAFMIFANEWRRKLATQHPNESNKEISVRLGVMWKNLGGNSKEDYFAASRQANEDHKKKYPDYYYSPKEARMRKRWKLQQQQVNQMMSTGQYNPVHLVKVYMNEESEGGENKKSSNSSKSSPH